MSTSVRSRLVAALAPPPPEPEPFGTVENWWARTVAAQLEKYLSLTGEKPTPAVIACWRHLTLEARDQLLREASAAKRAGRP